MTEDATLTDDTMGISAAAGRTGLSVDTIRYYDRLGLLVGLGRDPAGQRRFTEGDLGWLDVLRCLRDTGMPVRDLQRFVAMGSEAGALERLALLEEHRRVVLDRIRRTREELVVIEGKIAAYRRVVGERS